MARPSPTARGDGAIRVEQDATRCPSAATASERPRHRSRGDGLRRREALGVLLETLDAEEFLADGLFVVPRRIWRRAPDDAKDRRFQIGLSARDMRTVRSYLAHLVSAKMR